MNPPQLDKRGLIFPVIHLQAHTVSLIHDCSDCRLNEKAGVQRHGYAVTDLELP